MNSQTARRPWMAGVIIACTAATLTVTAQTTTSTSGSFEPETTALVMEAKVDLANIKTPAPLPAALTGLVSSGILEFRSRTDNFDPIGRTARVTLFLAGAGTSLPTAAEKLPAVTDATMISQSIVRFETILQSKGSWTGMGHFVNFLGGALPVPPGTIFVTSFGYTYADITANGSSTAGFTEFSFVIPNAFNLYASAPTGSISMAVQTSPKSVQ